jgi:hypothetical protein
MLNAHYGMYYSFPFQEKEVVLTWNSSRRSKTLENREAIVSGPTPQGTGVRWRTLSSTFSILTSQTAFQSL